MSFCVKLLSPGTMQQRSFILFGDEDYFGERLVLYYVMRPVMWLLYSLRSYQIQVTSLLAWEQVPWFNTEIQC